ncbi:36166_t:CDS:2 [Gigaspora margarita]|uniref:36166_t:CDS:1 n=1 Tax=Gigaspora margarita TaxID=4874 RepID=A0ABM8VX76_GIGMA|nr:36166_t:CDS:2 [Gigaspora margarita]
MGNREHALLGACVGGLIMIIYAYFSSFISDHFDSEAICKRMLNGHGTI